jgi:hypothetical protein
MVDRERRFDNHTAPARAEATWWSGVSVVAALWLVISAFLFGGLAVPGGWNVLIVGLAVAVLGGIRAYGRVDAATLAWVNAMLGAWLVASPFVLGYTANFGRTWSSIVVGFVIVAFAIGGASRGRRLRPGWAPWAGAPGTDDRGGGDLRRVDPLRRPDATPRDPEDRERPDADRAA